MGFTIAKKVAEKAAVIALSMGESDNAVAIPDAQGMVLVRNESKAFHSRKDAMGIFMIPAALKTVIEGAERVELFFICTR